MRGDLIVQTQLHMAQAFGALADLIENSTGYAFTPVTFTELPAQPRTGMVFCISDSADASGTVTGGGGSNVVLAWYNANGWRVIGT